VAYFLKGRIAAYLCDDCQDTLDGATVRIYTAEADDTLTFRAAADPRQTSHAREEAEESALTRRLLGEGTVSTDGAFSVTLDDGYGGGPLDVDLFCGTLGKGRPPKPRQLAITTVQPQWRRTEDGAVAAFEHTIPARMWCSFLALLGWWSICGRVTVCGVEPAVPVPGVTVSAFDRDWLQDDPLGSDITDGSGRYRIVYTRPEFEKTIFSWINVETQPGPDVYFRVTAPGGGVLLDEPPSTGRTAGRENVGPCLCVDLCVQAGGQGGSEPIPAFRYIGFLNYLTQVDSGPAGTGLTLADQRAFFADLRLNGPIGKTLNGSPLEYRVEVRELPSGAWTPVLASQIQATKIGDWQRLLGATLEVKSVVVNGTPDPVTIVVTPAADGWITMPQGGDLFTGLFLPNLDMIRLNSRAIASWATRDVGAVSAGNSSAPLLQDRFFGIRLRVRSASSPEASGGECQRLAIANVRYNKVNKGGSWVPTQEDDRLGVASLDVQELIASGCAGITNSLTVKVTAAHPNLGDVTLKMTGPGGPYGFTLPAAVAGERFGNAANLFTVSTLPKCSYLIELEATLLLTTG